MNPEHIIAMLSAKASFVEAISKGMEENHETSPLASSNEALDDETFSGMPALSPVLSRRQSGKKGAKPKKITNDHTKQCVSDEEFEHICSNLMAKSSFSPEIVEFNEIKGFTPDNSKPQPPSRDTSPRLTNDEIKQMCKKLLSESFDVDGSDDEDSPSTDQKRCKQGKIQSVRTSRQTSRKFNRYRDFENALSTLPSQTQITLIPYNAPVESTNAQKMGAQRRFKKVAVRS